ncbi:MULTISPECIES: methyltransferase family protein [Paracoccus]|uniref:methyltransferase family protein n=1 Tax=Paracoccus TaxID=265 RepID=UPI00223E8F93|nr:isoprenylcysteine carboxylmethyltransferase family protein [Paracoccus beibuensis]
MLSEFGWAALALLAGYLLLFFWGSALAAQAANRSVWLFGQARGRDRWAAFGFRAAFVLAFLGPLLWLVWPSLHKSDPFWTEGEAVALGLIGIFVSGAGAMLAFAAQMSMGSSWRVGVAEGATGTLVSGGLYRFSRNPTFMGQIILLAGVSLAIPAVPTILAPLLFLWSASTQIRSEESELKQALGADYSRYLATVPRWIGFHRRTSS